MSHIIIYRGDGKSRNHISRNGPIEPIEPNFNFAQNNIETIMIMNLGFYFLFILLRIY